jgi:alkylation response protein AidB-like acyl-CoA dehydrogenase
MQYRLTEEQVALRTRARAFAETVVLPRAAEVDRTESYPWDTVEALNREGFLGMTIPSDYGGAGKSLLDAVIVTEEIFAAETAVRVTNDALQIFGAAGYSRNNPLERMVRDARMFTIGGGTTQVLRTLVASRLLGRRLPQTRDGYRSP